MRKPDNYRVCRVLAFLLFYCSFSKSAIVFFKRAFSSANCSYFSNKSAIAGLIVPFPPKLFRWANNSKLAQFSGVIRRDKYFMLFFVKDVVKIPPLR